jgi:hypothetical protein
MAGLVRLSLRQNLLSDASLLATSLSATGNSLPALPVDLLTSLLWKDRTHQDCYQASSVEVLLRALKVST